MNSFERIMATIKGEKTDKRAFTATLSQYGVKYCGATNQEYYKLPEVYTKGQIAVFDKFGTDVIFGPFALSLFGNAFGADLKYYPDRPPLFKAPGIKSVEELLDFPYPDLNSDPDLMFMRNCIKQLSAHFGNEVPVAAISLNPLDLPIMIYGMDKWLDILLFDKQAFNKTMEYIVPFFIDYTNALISDGAACVIMPTVFANSNSVSRQQTVDIVNPILRSAFSEINGGLVMHHGGVPFLPYLDTYRDFPPNVLGFALDWTDNYHEARKAIGNERLLFYGIEGPSMYIKQKHEIKDRCLAILKMTEEDQKFVLNTCSSDILTQTPEENILAIGEAVSEYNNIK